MDVAETKSRAARWGLILLVLVALAIWGYVEFTLHWSYSDGERVGILQKVSRDGWLCKTNEGELALYIVSGVAPQLWNFSVRDAAVVQQLNAHLGERVRLHYTEHHGVPTSCFGETQYFVDEVLPLKPENVSP